MSSQSRVGRMAPPPVPLDPMLDPWPRPMMPSPNTSRNDRGGHNGQRYHERDFLSSTPGDRDISRVMLPAPRLGDQEADPLLRFWAAPDGPWNSQAITGVSETPVLMRDMALQDRVVRPHASFTHFREPAKSDPGSHLTGRGPSDSGYATKSQVTRSVISADYQDQSQENHSLAGGVYGIQIQSDPQDYSYRNSQDTHSISYENLSNDPRETANALVSAYECQECHMNCKNQSDYK